MKTPTTSVPSPTIPKLPVFELPIPIGDRWSADESPTFVIVKNPQPTNQSTGSPKPVIKL